MAENQVYVVPTCATAEVELAEEFTALVKSLAFKAKDTVIGSGRVHHGEWAYLDRE